MKTYTITMKVPEGYDEFWEDMDKLSARDAKEKLKHELLSCLHAEGWFDVEIKMGKVEKE